MDYSFCRYILISRMNYSFCRYILISRMKLRYSSCRLSRLQWILWSLVIYGGILIFYFIAGNNRERPWTSRGGLGCSVWPEYFCQSLPGPEYISIMDQKFIFQSIVALNIFFCTTHIWKHMSKYIYRVSQKKGCEKYCMT